jgi:hypothetical protein
MLSVHGGRPAGLATSRRYGAAGLPPVNGRWSSAFDLMAASPHGRASPRL